MTNFFARHEALLDRAIAATAARDYFSAYPESASPKVYGETARAQGDAAFEALIGKPFALDDRHPNERLVGAEASPFGKPLDVRYPTASVETLIAASHPRERPGAALPSKHAPGFSSRRCRA